MGLETPNAGPIPYDVFIGRGWEEDIIWPLDDLSDVTDVRVGLSRQGVPASKYELALTEGHLLLDYCPLEGEAVGGLSCLRRWRGGRGPGAGRAARPVGWAGRAGD